MQLTVHRAGAVPAELGEAWRAMCAANPRHFTAFVHPDVAAAAATVVPETRVAVVHDGGQPVAFLPFERRGTTGLPIAADVSDGDGLVTATGVDFPLLALLRACGLTSLSWTHRAPRADPLQPFDNLVLPAARVDLGGGFDAYLARRPGSDNIFRDARRKLRRLEREVGPVELELDADHAGVDRLVAWKAAQLRAAGDDTHLDRSDAVDLLRAFGTHLAGGQVRSLFTVLRAGGRPVAMTWGLVAHGVLVSSLPAYDEAMSRHSPGVLMHVRMLQELPSIGVEEVDLGLGVDRMKSRLLTHTVPLARGTAHTTVAGRVVRRLRTAVRKVRRGF